MEIDNNLETSFGQLDLKERVCLADWDLPPSVVKAYRERGINEMFSWQAECLALPGVWTQTRDLVLAAPTSGGKSLIAELLSARTAIRKGKKAVIVLPFKALVAEKTNYLKTLFVRTGLKVVSYTGSSSMLCPFSMVDIAVCVTEKANALINQLVSEDSVASLGLVVADELHTLADSSRGYILEMLLSKIKFLKNSRGADLQVVGMSATMGNLDEVASWLSAVKYRTDFRPVLLQQRILMNGSILDSKFEKVEEYKRVIDAKDDPENVIDLTVKSVLDGQSVLIFCMTKAHCEALSVKIAKEIIKVGRGKFGQEMAQKIQEHITETAALEMRSLIDTCMPSSELRTCVCFGVAFHHAGLSDDERSVIEDGFRSGRLRILVATSTLCSGVNLPASVVIVRMGNRLDKQMYLQMIGRAGRTGVTTTGTSFLTVSSSLLALAKKLTSEDVAHVTPSLGSNLMRAVLEAVSIGLTRTHQQIISFVNSTFYGFCKTGSIDAELEEVIEDLATAHYLRRNEELTEATRLGSACVAAGARPQDAKMLYEELEQAQKSFALDTELHLCYITTPLYSSDWGSFDWLSWMKMYSSLPAEYLRVANLVGVKENFIGVMMAKSSNVINQQALSSMEKHQRFFKALAMMDLIKENSIADIAAKFGTSKGAMQSLQQSAAMQAGRVKAFCQQLGWTLMAVLMKSLQQRLQFGVLPELCDLMRVELLNGQQARAFYQAGIESVADLARSSVEIIERILINMPKFGSVEQEKQVQLGVFLEGIGALPERQASTLILQHAREVVQQELGLEGFSWEQKQVETPPRGSQPACTQESQTPEKIEIDDALAALEATCNTPHRTPAKGEIERLGLSPDLFDASLEGVEQNVDKVAVIKVSKELEPHFYKTLNQIDILSFSMSVESGGRVNEVVLGCEVADEVFIFVLSLEVYLDTIRGILSSKHLQISMNNALLKIRHLLHYFNTIESQIFDPVLAAWILNPDKPSYSLAQLVQNTFPELTDLVSNLSRQNWCPTNESDAITECIMTAKISCQLKAWLESRKLISVLNDIDIKAVKVLAECEHRGFFICNKECSVIENQIIDTLDKLKIEAATYASCNFDPNKSSDVKKVIYNKLKLGDPKSKQSTSKEALQALEGKHPLPKLIIEYRKLHHILTTILHPILNNLEKSVVHPRYNFLIATGRVHMYDPNLQSVPRDFALPDGSILSVRSMFVARPGYCLVSADYRQIELRLMVHLSNDGSLIKLMNSGEDVFVRMASMIHKTNDVSDEMRRQAKQVCYGLLYGMGVDKLKEELKAPADQVHVLYETIQEQLSSLFEFKESVEKQCRDTGRVTSMYGRVRLMKLARNAANTIVQSSAADIAKMAMARVKKALRKQRVEAHLLLHMHDELIYETRTSDMEKLPVNYLF
ncbi:Hypothetical predicted protein [Cloeon dipterum]|uniref:DNA-directed DNA polymerase n=1 Tax=Cloeon dipterum TaxID=197152 RepID=A0A8S1DHZ3_9INSE|nr:Hypothetical predicted protein [Cloeon dipterum]